MYLGLIGMKTWNNRVLESEERRVAWHMRWMGELTDFKTKQTDRLDCTRTCIRKEERWEKKICPGLA